MKEQRDKQERILQAAQECLLLYGFRRTSMEDIARQSGMSRAALYLVFSNKEEIFRSLLQQFREEALARAEAALQATGTLDERLTRAFESRDLPIIEMLQTSPHGAEFVELDHGIGADIAQDAERRFQEALTHTLQEAGQQGAITLARAGMSADQYAALLDLAVQGMKRYPCPVDVYRTRLTQIVRVFCLAVAVHL